MSAALLQQMVSVAAALLLLTSFALLAQRRMRALLHWFSAQGIILAVATAMVANEANMPELYFSAAMTLLLKGIFLPWLTWRIVVRLGVHREVEQLVNISATALIGAALVLYAVHVTLPIIHFSHLVTRNTIAIAMASLFLGMLMMITRRQAVAQVVAFLSIENALFFTATAATYGMPLVVELGVAFDVLIAGLIFGLFFYHIRSSFESLDLHDMEHH